MTADSTGLLWKAAGLDGTTNGNGRGERVHWTVGEVVTHPTSTVMVRDKPWTYLSCSAEPAETLIGLSWPCRLRLVEPLGDVIGSDQHPHKRCILTGRVVAETEPWRALGPNGRQAAAVIERCRVLMSDELDRLTATWSSAWSSARGAAWSSWGSDAAAAAESAAENAARDAARDAAGAAAWDAAWSSARPAARDAAWAVVVRDLITVEQYDLLAGPVVSVIGPIEDLPVPAWVDEIGP